MMYCLRDERPFKEKVSARSTPTSNARQPEGPFEHWPTGLGIASKRLKPLKTMVKHLAEPSLKPHRPLRTSRRGGRQAHASHPALGRQIHGFRLVSGDGLTSPGRRHGSTDGSGPPRRCSPRTWASGTGCPGRRRGRSSHPGNSWTGRSTWST